MKPVQRLSALLALGALLALPSTAFASHTYKGRVVSVEAGQLVLAMGTEQLTFIVATDTRIFLDGSPAELDKIERGYSARVKADRLGDVFVARKIRAKTAKISSARDVRLPYASAPSNRPRVARRSAS